MKLIYQKPVFHFTDEEKLFLIQLSDALTEAENECNALITADEILDVISGKAIGNDYNFVIK